MQLKPNVGPEFKPHLQASVMHASQPPVHVGGSSRTTNTIPRRPSNAACSLLHPCRAHLSDTALALAVIV